MTRNLKALGLTLLAAFALSAVAASGALAVKITVGASPAWLTGEVISHPNIGKVHALTLSGGQSITCAHVTFIATVKNADSNVTIIPIYKECNVRIGPEILPATVTLNDCDAVWHGGVEVSSTTFKEGEIDLVCPEGKKVEIHIYKKAPHEAANELCTYSVSPFTNKKANEFHNVAGTPNDATITTTAIEVGVTRTGSLLCGAASTNATYTGSSTLKAFEDLSGTISEGTVSGVVEGAQVDVTASK